MNLYYITIVQPTLYQVLLLKPTLKGCAYVVQQANKW